MNRSRIVAALFALLFTAGIAVARPADDRPVVVIVPMKGPSASSVEQTCEHSLKSAALVLSSRRYAIVAKQLVAVGTSPEEVAAVANELGAQWALTGTVKVDEGAWTLSVSLREGKTGRARARLKYPLQGPRVTPAVLHTLENELRSALVDALGSPGPGPEPINPDATRRPVTKAPTGDPGPVEPAATDPENPAPMRAAQPTTGRPKWARWFSLAVGATLTGRHFAFSPTSVGQFRSVVVGGVHLEGAVYPLAFTWNRAKGVFSGLGLTIRLDKPVWPNSMTPAMPESSFPTQELRVEGGLNWKFTLYKGMPRPQLHLIASGGVHEFGYAKGAGGADVVGVPNARYTYASFGGGLTVHFADWSWIWADFVYHLVTAAGEIETQPYFGLASHYGLRFQGGLDFLVWRGIRVGAMGFYERFGAAYGYDPNRARIADGSTDEYYGAMLLVGYVF